MDFSKHIIIRRVNYFSNKGPTSCVVKDFPDPYQVCIIHTKQNIIPLISKIVCFILQLPNPVNGIGKLTKKKEFFYQGVPITTKHFSSSACEGGADHHNHLPSFSPLMQIGRFLAVAVAAFGIAACGGGGSGGTADNTASAPQTLSMSVSGFSPSSGAVGTVITVSGVGLDAVVAAKVGNAEAAVQVDSAVQVRVTVPMVAQAGRIEVSGRGRVALSATDFSVSGIPVVNLITPKSVPPGGRLNVSGVNLNLVQQARLNTSQLSIVDQSPTALTLDVPGGATGGFLTLVDSTGVARPSAQQITIVQPLAITSFTPATILRGQILTVTGSGLDRVQTVQFGGNASAAVASHGGSTSLTVVVPGAASSGAITLFGDANDNVVSANSLAVADQITADTSVLYRVAAGEPVRIVGAGLTEVSGVTVAGSAAVITSQTDTDLTFTVPAGVNCGMITLLSPTQTAVIAGSVIVGNGCTLRAAGIEFAQVLSQAATDSYQRLVPAKETLVRVYVVAETSGVVAPSVFLNGFNGGTSLGTLTMTGPVTLPVLAIGQAVPASLRYQEAQSFNVDLPANWVDAGMHVEIKIDSEELQGSPLTLAATPAIGKGTGVDLVLVPLVSGANVPRMPALTDVLDELTRLLPVPREKINVTMRAPHTLTSVTDGVDTSAEWSLALAELEQLRRSEAPGRQYYGMVRSMDSSGTVGMGYINTIGSFSPKLSALGWDASRSWRRTMSHELGHNYSRAHAPCGSVATWDPKYPYPGGALSATPLFDSLADDILSPAEQTDIMGYCSGVWFSDYNFRGVQSFLEARQPSAPSVSVAADGGEVLMVAGTIGVDGVRLRPLRRARGAAEISGPGDHSLRLRTTAGAVLEASFEAVDVDHAEPPEQHFFVRVPAPAGTMTAVEVRRRGVAIPLRMTSQLPSQGGVIAAAVKGASAVDWREVGGGALELSWNTAVSRYLSITHVLGATRTVLALDLSDGTARLDVSALPQGGEFEFSLSDGLDTQLIIVRR